MIPAKAIGVLILSILAEIIFSCKPQEIILHGDIKGIVTDAETSLPIQASSIRLNSTNDSTTTGDDGSFLFKNLTPGEYEIQASKFAYALNIKNIILASTETKEIDFSLIGIPGPDPSPSFLDFRLDSTTLSFSFSNSGKGRFIYLFTPSQPWITLSPAYGDITNETDHITVTINKTGLSESIYKESIKVTSFAGQVPLPDFIIPVYLNGAMDGDGNYYKVVRIGSQTWMAENLKTTRYNDGTAVPFVTENNTWNSTNTPGYCWYDDQPIYKDIYGALYNWYAVNTNKLCPTGWHVPTYAEWTILTNYLGSVNDAGGKLKEKGTTHWHDPNSGTNESGFTALPGGVRYPGGFILPDYGPTIGAIAGWWSSTIRTSDELPIQCDLIYNVDDIYFGGDGKESGYSVRCIKD